MSEHNQTLAAFPFVAGGMSTMLAVGVVLGATAVIWGIFTRSAWGKRLALIGMTAIVLTASIYSSTYYVAFVQHDDLYDRLREALAQNQLNELVPAIELYRVQHGAYPASLDAVGNLVSRQSLLYDPTDSSPWARRRQFYYQRVGSDQYILRSVGLDGMPFTAEDILPQVDSARFPQSGLLLSPPGPSPDAGALQR